MFLDRLTNDVKKFKERSALKYFKITAKLLKREEEASIEMHREHGAPKDKNWHDKLCLKN